MAWLLALLVVFGGATLVGWIDLGPWASQPVVGDVFVAVLTVVPYLVYLVWTEAGPTHATWGNAAADSRSGPRPVNRRDRVPCWFATW